MFLFKKIVAPLFFPVPLSCELLLIGLVFLWFTGKQKTGRVLVTAGAALLLLCGYRTMPQLLLSPLENRYLPLNTERESQDTQIRWIVVLGGGHVSDPRLPASAALTDDSGMRVVEAIRIWRKMPETKILFSGGKGFDTQSDAGVMSRMAQDLGVPAGSIALEDRSRDTNEEAQLIEPLVGKNPFVLVTSASHMPRSMRLFVKRGMHPIAAPAGFKSKQLPEGGGISPSSFYPSSANLGNAERAVYELLGLAWEKLNGHI
jgi:uncharacterized SAM-binding protein YcdF (DUF218 family)